MEHIRELVALDPETELVDHVYLGCTQRAVPPRKSVVLAKQKLFSQLMSKESSDPEAGGGDSSDSLSEKRSLKNPMLEFVHPSILNPSLTDKDLEDITSWDLDMCGHAIQCVDRYCELAGCTPASLKKGCYSMP